MTNSQWRGGSQIRQMYKYTNADKNRMGNCDWLPKNGDVCVATQHSGDCFFTFVALRKQKNGQYIRVGEFGAYNFGTPLGLLDERTFHLACAGEPVSILPNELLSEPLARDRKPEPHAES